MADSASLFQSSRLCDAMVFGCGERRALVFEGKCRPFANRIIPVRTWQPIYPPKALELFASRNAPARHFHAKIANFNVHGRSSVTGHSEFTPLDKRVALVVLE